MIKYLLVVISFLCLTSFVHAYVLSGYIFDSAYQPIPNISVELEDNNETLWLENETNENGHFEFTNLSQGVYRIDINEYEGRYGEGINCRVRNNVSSCQEINSRIVCENSYARYCYQYCNLPEGECGYFPCFWGDVGEGYEACYSYCNECMFNGTNQNNAKNNLERYTIIEFRDENEINLTEDLEINATLLRLNVSLILESTNFEPGDIIKCNVTMKNNDIFNLTDWFAALVVEFDDDVTYEEICSNFTPTNLSAGQTKSFMLSCKIPRSISYSELDVSGGMANFNWNVESSGGNLTAETYKVVSKEIKKEAPSETEVLWEIDLPINVSENEIKNILTDLAADLLKNTTGKLELIASLYSNTDQIIAQNNSFFYITNKNTSLTLETDKDIYKPNELIKIYGNIQNNAVIVDTYNLSIKKGAEKILFKEFTLQPGEIYSFITNTTAERSFTLEGTVNDEVITDFIRVEKPSLNFIDMTQEIVGIKPFDVSILVENIGDIEANINVSIGNNTFNIILPKSESQLIKTIMISTENTTLAIIISGDVNEIIQKEIVCGENTKITIKPEPSNLEGTVEIPFTIENIGILDSSFNATFSIDNKTILKSFFVPKDQNITDTVSFNLSKGLHLLAYISPFEQVQKEISVQSPPEFTVSSILPTDMQFTIGQNVTLIFEVENIGGSEGEALLTLMMPDFEDRKRTWIKPTEKEVINFSFTIPDDLEEKEYKGIYEINGARREFTFFVQGAKITVNASLDKELYDEGENALLKLDITNNCSLNLSLFARIKLNEYEEIKYFNLSDYKELQFNVPVSFNDQKLFYGIYMGSGRSLYLNTLYVYKKGEILLHTDKQVYNQGEDVTIYLDSPGIVDITSLGLNASVNGPTSIVFTLPNEIRSGTYFIEAKSGNNSYEYPFDVMGYSGRILEASLDKEVYSQSDYMTVKINIETNSNVSALARFHIYDLQYMLIDSFNFYMDISQGENIIVVSRIFTTPSRGIHVLDYDIVTLSNVTIASGAEYFDVMDSFIISLNKGWNLVSVPLNLAQKSFDFYLNGMNYSVYSYDNGWSVPNEIDIKKGYWLKVNQSANLAISGMEPLDKDVPLDYGWNLVGYPYRQEQNVSSIFNSKMVYGYNDSHWYSYNPNRPDELNTLKYINPGYGYWVRVG